jgi:hypothetical protein
MPGASGRRGTGFVGYPRLNSVTRGPVADSSSENTLAQAMNVVINSLAKPSD